MKIKPLLLIAFTIIIAFRPSTIKSQIDEDFWKNQSVAFNTNSVEKLHKSKIFCEKVLKIVPNNPYINYLVARLLGYMNNWEIENKP